MAELQQYLVSATDHPRTGELRDPGGHPVRVRLGGPTLNAQGAMNGTLLVVQAESEAAVCAFVDADPSTRGGLFARVEIRRWQWSLGQPDSTQPVELS